MKRIAIIIEVKKRELPFMSILREALKNKGYKVKLIPFRSLCLWKLLAFRPDVVLINGLRHEYPYYVSQVYFPKLLFKSKIACYYSEQVGYYEQSIAKGYFNRVIFDNVDYHISWGPRFTKDLLEMGVPLEKLWYIGSIQYDIDKYLKKTTETLKQELSEMYNIPLNMKWVIYTDNIIESYQKEGLYGVRRRDTFDMVEKVALVNNDCHIIFRHHPDTPPHEIEEARKRFSNMSNVSIIPTGHIFDWTCCVSALIMWVSTSSLQAMFMGKPVFGFMTSDGKNLENYWYKDIFPTFNNADELAQAIRLTLNNDSTVVDAAIEKNRTKYISDWYFKKDGLAFERLCCLLDIVANSDFHKLTDENHYGIGTLIKLLYKDLRIQCGSMRRKIAKENNITNKEVETELLKYDIARFDVGKSFVIETTKEGHYLV